MESDSIRASGSNTLIDIWIEGKLRAICVTRPAIDSFRAQKGLPADPDGDACEYIRGQLPQVVSAAKTKLRSDPLADNVTIDAGELGAVGERRQDERRKDERRKADRPAATLPHGERRKGERRKTGRRKSPKEG
jgi:hypothetical protein